MRKSVILIIVFVIGLGLADCQKRGSESKRVSSTKTAVPSPSAKRDRLHADSIYIQSGGKERICAQDVILVEKRDNLVYYNDNENGIIVQKDCSFSPEKGESVLIMKASPEERRVCIDNWKKSGHTARIVDTKNKEYLVHNLALDFDAPPGYILTCMGRCPSPQTSITLQSENRQTAAAFSTIETIAVRGDILAIKLVNGKELSGPLLYREIDGKKLVPNFWGINDKSTMDFVRFELKLKQIRSITFVRKGWAGDTSTPGTASDAAPIAVTARVPANAGN